MFRKYFWITESLQLGITLPNGNVFPPGLIRNVSLQWRLLLITFCITCWKHEGLTVSYIEVHLAVISAFHPLVVMECFFPKLITIKFLKGLDILHSQVQESVPPWDRNLMLAKLMGSPFEPLAIFSLLNLSMWLFSCSYQQGEWVHWESWSQNLLIFHKDKVYLCPYPKFLKKGGFQFPH